MANFFNTVTKEYRVSVHTPDYEGQPNWVKTNDITLPLCQSIFWKHENNQIVEMTDAEKTSILNSRKRNKTKTEVMHDIFVAFPVIADFERVLDALDSVPSFETALEMGSIEVASKRLLKAKGKNLLTDTEYNTIKTILDTKV